jgi:YrbI family 3-deoxy-D-manno-octulosonate 8-phosphate phosphatase
MKIDFSNISFVVFDFDGVFTDNTVIVDDSGRESVVCNRSDGIGLQRLQKNGVTALILSSELNDVVKHRAEKMKVPCTHGVKEKLAVLKDEIKKRGLSPAQVAYVGNDVNDMDCLKYVGMPIVVADAHEDVLHLGKFVTRHNGGDGAVREICDLISKAKEEVLK